MKILLLILFPFLSNAQQYIRTQHGNQIWLVNINGLDSTLLPSYDLSGAMSKPQVGTRLADSMTAIRAAMPSMTNYTTNTKLTDSLNAIRVTLAGKQASGSYLVAADIVGKLNKTDTAVMLLAYQNGLNGKQASLGYTPYNATNPNGYISAVPAQTFASITGQPTDNTNLTTALNTRLAVAGNGSQLTGITNTQVSGLGTLSTQNGTIANYLLSATAASTYAPITSASLVTPNINVATGTSLAVSGAITSSGGGIGYTSGNGSTVSQLTNKSTAVTINKLCGTIAMVNSALAAATIVTFTVNNSTVAATDVIIVQHDNTGTIGAYTIAANTSAAGSFKISVRNNTAGSLSEAIVIRYAIIKAVIN